MIKGIPKYIIDMLNEVSEVEFEYTEYDKVLRRFDYIDLKYELKGEEFKPVIKELELITHVKSNEESLIRAITEIKIFINYVNKIFILNNIEAPEAREISRIAKESIEAELGTQLDMPLIGDAVTDFRLPLKLNSYFFIEGVYYRRDRILLYQYVDTILSSIKEYKELLNDFTPYEACDTEVGYASIISKLALMHTENIYNISKIEIIKAQDNEIERTYKDFRMLSDFYKEADHAIDYVAFVESFNKDVEVLGKPLALYKYNKKLVSYGRLPTYFAEDYLDEEANKIALRNERLTTYKDYWKVMDILDYVYKKGRSLNPKQWKCVIEGMYKQDDSSPEDFLDMLLDNIELLDLVDKKESKLCYESSAYLLHCFKERKVL